MGASFVHANGRVDFRSAPARPERSLAVIQPERKTAGEYRYGYAHTIVDDKLPITLRMSAAELAQFETFFYNTVRGMSELFFYTAGDGSSYAVRFAQSRLNGLREVAADMFHLPVQLLVFPSSWQWADGSTMQFDNGQEIAYG